jgi:hypothetical protein
MPMRPDGSNGVGACLVPLNSCQAEKHFSVSWASSVGLGPQIQWQAGYQQIHRCTSSMPLPIVQTLIEGALGNICGLETVQKRGSELFLTLGHGWHALT